MKLALFLCGALIPGPIPAYEVVNNTSLLSQDEMRACINEGGCRLVTKDWVKDQIRQLAAQICKGSV